MKRKMTVVLAVILTAWLVGCDIRPLAFKTTEIQHVIIIIDECEYVIYKHSTRSAGGITHKGNCKNHKAN